MSIIKLTAEKKVDLTILVEPEIQVKKQQLFDNMKEKIRTRFDEIVSYLNVEPVNEFSYENIMNFFDPAFLYEILQLAVEKALTGYKEYDLKENILACLSEENLESAIMGDPTIEAFKDAINSTPAEDAYEHAHRGALIYNLETMDDEEYFDGNSEQKCTVKRDDEKAKEFYEDWPDTLSPQWKDGKYLGCKYYANGKELKGFSTYLEDDIDE